jgi:hypothetical protein
VTVDLSPDERKDFERWKSELPPDSVPEGTPEEKIFKHYQAEKTRKKQRENEKAMARIAGDISEEQSEKERAIEVEARRIYESGDFLGYAKDVFKKIWYGDSYILQAIFYIVASYRALNVDEGVHLHVQGTTQSGKSDSVKTALKFIHPMNKLTKTFSDKYLFYAENAVPENTIIFSDDTVLPENTKGLFRNILTSWNEGVCRGTVISQKPVEQKVSRHVNLILTSINEVVEESEDGQDESRFLSLEVRRSPEDESAIRKFVQEPKEDISQELKIIHKIWEIMPVHTIKSHRTIDKAIPIRDLKRYLTLMKSNAILSNRDETTEEDVSEVEQFLSYSRPMIDATTSAYTRKELAVKGIMRDTWLSVEEIQKITGLTTLNVYRALRGKTGTFNNPSGGLLAKDKNIGMTYNPDTHSYDFKILRG